MKKYSKLWHQINTLLSLLRAVDAKKLVDDYYLKMFSNPAPGECLFDAMESLQKTLNEAKEQK